MQVIDLGKIRADVITSGERILASDQLDVMIAGALLTVVFLLAVAAIWRGRRRAAAVASQPAPVNASGFKRWLTPMGMQSIPAEQAVVVRPRRKSGSQKTIRVSTPVSKVPTRALKRAGADALEIARKTGLARDAVVMMLANANPQMAVARSQSVERAAVKHQPAPTRNVSSDRAMSAPGAYAPVARTQPANAPQRGDSRGTRFSARVS
jgi:hypothetical protein